MVKTEYSRIAATAGTLGELAEDSHRFLDKRVLLTGEPDVLMQANARESALCALRLLARMTTNLTVHLPNSTLASEATAIASRLAYGQPIEVVTGTPAYVGFDAILNIGMATRPDLPWTAINSDGWLVRVASGASDLARPLGMTNPIAALAAASLGTTEVFKRLLGVRASRGPLIERLSWSLFSYESDNSDLGPELPSSLELDGLIAGIGAIGNGLIHLLAQLPFSGRLVVVDPQPYRQENLGTCLLLTPDQLGTSKAALAKQVLSARFECHAFDETIESFSARLGAELPFPKVVLGALDNIDARHSAQDLWPDLLIDGAIGPLACQVSRHPVGNDVACIRCLFRHPPGERAEVAASRASGLSVVRVVQDDVVRTNDVEAAPPGKREALARQLGRPICSVVSESVTRDLAEKSTHHFEPSVPFVACLSAAMMVAELVKAIDGAPSDLEPRFQFDVLRGPAFGQFLPQERRRGCVCSARAPIIEQWRRHRRRGG